MMQCTALGAAIALPLWLACGSASALTTLTFNWTDVTCGIVAADGTQTAAQTCTGGGGVSPSFSAVVNAGESVFVSANLRYTYSDDGLGLERPFAFQLDPSGLRVRFVDHEAAALYALSNDCQSRYCQRPPELTDAFVGPFVLILGDNAFPDSFSGEQNYFASAGLSAGSPYGQASRGAFLAINGSQVLQGVAAPIPEPATSALMLFGLVAVVGATRRRR